MREEDVKFLMREAGLADSFDWLCKYIADILTARENFCKLKPATEPIAKSLIDGIRCEVGKRRRPGKQYIQDALVSYLGAYGDVVDEEDLDQISLFPTLPVVSGEQEALLELHLLRTKYVDHLSRFPNMRTAPASQRGQKLAEVAESLEGWFRWVNAGPDPATHAPKERWMDDEDIQHEDHFAMWINKGAEQNGMPVKTSCMNCWEAVFFSAYKAGLVAYEDLRIIHKKATEGRGAKYFDCILNALGINNAIQLEPRLGLVPSRGDIIFVNWDHHVMICLGTKVKNTDLKIRVMSLWNNPETYFCRTTTKKWAVFSKQMVMTFAPCPF